MAQHVGLVSQTLIHCENARYLKQCTTLKSEYLRVTSFTSHEFSTEGNVRIKHLMQNYYLVFIHLYLDTPNTMQSLNKYIHVDRVATCSELHNV